MKRVLALRELIVVAAASIAPAFSLGTTMGAMIGAAGRFSALALAVVAVLMAAIAHGYRKLGERMRDAGSSFVWIRAAFGGVAGAYAAWVLIVANVLAIVATALPAGTATLDLLAPARAGDAAAVGAVASLWTLAATIVLWWGLRPTAFVAFGLLAAEIGILGAAAIAAALHPRPDAVAFAPGGIDGGAFIAAIVIGVWMVDGWEVSASTAEEAHGSASLPGLGGMAGLVIAAATFLVAILGFDRVGSASGYAAHSADALAYVGSLLGGSWRTVLDVTLLVSLAASLQTTLVYLSRSAYAMGRDRLLPAGLGELDRRRQPGAAIALVAGLSIAFCLCAGLWPSANAAFGFALGGTAWFLGLLFVLSAAAALRFGWLLPGAAGAILAVVLAVALVRDDPATRGFIAAGAALGVPLALWRGRSRSRALGTEGDPAAGVRRTLPGSRF